MPYFLLMKAWDFCRSQLRRMSWIKTEAEVLDCSPGDYLWDSDYLYMGVSHYIVQVRYSADGHEVLTEFRWGKPLAEGRNIFLRYDPANPEYNSRTGLWLIRTFLIYCLIGLFLSLSLKFNCGSA